nr:hypothetical protein [Candidatus Sigynarchaeota archaeon]
MVIIYSIEEFSYDMPTSPIVWPFDGSFGSIEDAVSVVENYIKIHGNYKEQKPPYKGSLKSWKRIGEGTPNIIHIQKKPR